MKCFGEFCDAQNDRDDCFVRLGEEWILSDGYYDCHCEECDCGKKNAFSDYINVSTSQIQDTATAVRAIDEVIRDHTKQLYNYKASVGSTGNS